MYVKYLLLFRQPSIHSGQSEHSGYFNQTILPEIMSVQALWAVSDKKDGYLTYKLYVCYGLYVLSARDELIHNTYGEQEEVWQPHFQKRSNMKKLGQLY